MTVEGDHATAKSELAANTSIRISISIVTDVLPSSVGNLTSVFSLLPSCDSCLVIQGFNTLRDAKTFSKFFKLDISLPEEEDEEHVISSIYLMGGLGQQTYTDQPQHSFQTEELCVHSFIC